MSTDTTSCGPCPTDHPAHFAFTAVDPRACSRWSSRARASLLLLLEIS